MSGFKKEREFLASLSGEQAAAANEFRNPVLLVAGAGSGKTRTLIGRATKLLMPSEEGGIGANPKTLMMVTFTNKAAGEMKERFSPILKGLSAAGIYGDPWVGTFHSISMRILREEAKHAGLGANFSIIDDSDSREVAKDSIKTAGIEGMDIDEFFNGLEFVKARLYQPRLLIARKREMEKNAVISGFVPTPVQKEWKRILENVLPEGFETVYDNYQKILLDNNAVDFSDLINSVTLMLRSNPEIRNSWRSRFRHFMVDESQDMNPAQAAWLGELTGKGMETDFDPRGLEENVFGEVIVSEHGHTVNLENLRDFPRPSIMFVGDPRQSIYGFRGSDPRMMEGLPENYDGLKVLELVESYRCAENILSSANRLISKNGERFGKGMVSADPARIGVPVEIRSFKSWRDEFDHIGKEISASVKGGMRPAEIGVLTRTRAAAKEVASYLREIGVPVTEGKASDIRKSVEYKDVMAYANFLINADGEIFLRRIINKPARGMGMKSIGNVMANAKLKGVGFIDELKTIMNNRIDLPEGAEAYGKAFIGNCKDFGLLIVRMRNDIIPLGAADALDMIMRRTGYLTKIMEEAMSPLNLKEEERGEMADLPLKEFVKRVIDIRGNQKDAAEALGIEDMVDKIGGMSESMRRIGNLLLLMDQAQNAPSLAAFVQEASLELSQENEAPGVSVMTMHASKGREFENVYLPLWYESMMPHYNSTEGELLREERRLAYVGMTRAKNVLRMSVPSDIYGAKFSYGGSSNVRPSPFLNEVFAMSPDVIRYDDTGNVIRKPMAAAPNGQEHRPQDRDNRQQIAPAEQRKSANSWVFSKKRDTDRRVGAEGPTI